MPRRIILDCDPGHDDAIALLLAAGSPEIDLVAVTTVAGNQTLEKVTRNALAVGTIARIEDVPFAAGAERPLVREQVVAPEYHGESGLDGPELPAPTVALDARHAVDLIVETIMAAAPGEITLVPTGALTNLALAVRREPRIAERVREVVWMGGAAHGGNLSPVAEYNAAIDPEAVRIVLEAGWPVVMVGLDLTHQALADRSVLDAIAAVDGAPAAFTLELLEFFRGTYREQGFEWPPVHDVCAVAYVVDPGCMTVRSAPIAVELHGELTTGQTVVDLRHPAPASCVTSVALGLDAPRMWGHVVDALARLA
ncbi:nucleoside hydrolase [Agrococcus versicolor]|uniref:Nucleoside hydrolase n=1 Tax=Agrococcus versicolor TaxID=501482 RepID=A0ABP5MG06_9MICO